MENEFEIKSSQFMLPSNSNVFAAPHIIIVECADLCLAAIRCCKFLGKNPDESYVDNNIQGQNVIDCEFGYKR